MPTNRLGFARANSLQPSSILQLLLAGGLALGIGAGGLYLHPASFVPTINQQTASALPATLPSQAAIPAPAPVAQASAPTVPAATTMEGLRSAVTATIKPALNPKPEAVTREIEIERGAKFSDLLANAGVPSRDALAIASALGKVYDSRHLKSGQEVTLFSTRIGAEEKLNRITLQPEATKEVTIARNAAGDFAANIELVPLTHRHFAARGEIHSSLYEAGETAHVPHALMASFMRIYSHEVDFQRDIHPGDRFEILYDQPVARNGATAGEGEIIYAALIAGNKVKPVYRVTFSDGSIDYFDERGESVRRALLRTPVAAAHITSGFGMRMHPILGYSKMHQGVDFGAPPGAPIFAAGNGTVVEIGTKGGYGRYVRVRHNGQLETVYAHMSRFGQDLYRGADVKQGEVIGYVGASGRVTGPHLHFEVHVAGRAVNPLSVNLPTGRVLDGKLLVAFKKGESKIKQEFTSLLTKNGALFTQTSAPGPAFPVKEAETCGLRGGC